MNILFSKNKNLFAIIFLMTVSLATINLFISTFKVKNAFAITAEEMLTDPILEKRAREISANLRCLVCQNQSIDDSEVELAIDLRRQVRDYLVEGMTDDEIFQRFKRKVWRICFIISSHSTNHLPALDCSHNRFYHWFIFIS